ncbi:hypothetical protein AGMMS49921_13970 [Endomicrobiia bacterium]|nr:hypothetical protein AGMMS49921_13970 [Endomicrobiia bacterium]
MQLEKTTTDGKVKQAKDLTVEQSKSNEELVSNKAKEENECKELMEEKADIEAQKKQR